MWSWCKKKHAVQRHEIKSPKIEPHVYKHILTGVPWSFNEGRAASQQKIQGKLSKAQATSGWVFFFFDIVVVTVRAFPSFSKFVS